MIEEATTQYMKFVIKNPEKKEQREVQWGSVGSKMKPNSWKLDKRTCAKS